MGDFDGRAVVGIVVVGVDEGFNVGFNVIGDGVPYVHICSASGTHTSSHAMLQQ